MTLSLFDCSIPRYLRMLRNVSSWLDKAEAHAKENRIELSSLLEARLAPDMAPFTRQIQFLSDGAKGGAARLAGVEPPSFPDVETTWPALKARIAKTVAFVEGIKREQVDGRESATIELKFPNRNMTFSGEDFLFGFSMPNFLFHVVTAYGLLRAKGVPLGKMDYLA
jgi:hypothetical protein